MERLERWRDANEAIAARAAQPRGDRRRTRRASPRCARGPGKDSSGSATSTTASRSRRTTSAGSARRRPGRVTFTVGGFRADGARVERAASAIVTEERPSRPPAPAGERERSSLRFETRLWERVEPSPRFHDATAEAGLGAPRHDPPHQEGQPPDLRHLAGLGRRGARLRPGRRRGPLRRRRRALDPLPERRHGALHGRHREGRPREVRRPRASPRPASPRATSTATATPTSS